ncbi:MAG: hypothetical protein NTW48_10015 [Chloroflexi bacterium]|nr:hypothetical protein [Chloroflexota bacterium]
MPRTNKKKGRKLTTPIILAIAAVVLAIIVPVLIYYLPRIEDKVHGRHPDVYVYCYGMEHSYSIDQLREIAPTRSKITIVPIKFPEGVSSLEHDSFPLKLFDWKYSENEKLYTIVTSNKGDGIARNIKVDIDFTPNSIVFVKINNEKRVDLIQGGKPTGTRAVFKINELLPDEIQDIEILTAGKAIKSFGAWSETQGNIKNIYIFDVVVEPDR